VTVETTELTLPSRIDAVNEAAAAVARILGQLDDSEQLMFGIDMAIREAVTNAVLHGNKQDEAKQVRVDIKSSPAEIEISVHDAGGIQSHRRADRRRTKTSLGLVRNLYAYIC
jgi:serine/threonine-protein kinase RsbW